MKNQKRLLSLNLSLLMVSVLIGCRTQRQKMAANEVLPRTESPSPTPSNSSASESDLTVVECIKEEPFLEAGERNGMLKAWRHVPKNGNYRMVKASDFRIPDWVRNERYWSDVERATGWSHDYGELGGAYGLVLFMVDKTTTDAKRFSVAVLIRRPANRYDLYWIFQNADLSRVNLRRHSGDAYLEEFRDDRTSSYCDIQYNRKLRKWACIL
jgi:hypothetical protein